MLIGMLDRFHRLRDRWLADHSVRDRLGRMPIGRGVARRHADRLFALISGFAHAQMIAAAVDLDLFGRLAAGPVTRTDLAAAIDLPPAGFAALIDAMIGLELVETRGTDRLALAIDGLVVASDAGIRAMIAHHAALYADLADPVEMLRAPGRGRVGALWPYASAGGDFAAYSRLMAASQSFVGDALCAAYDFGRHRCVLDVGGGDGGFVAQLARRWPALRLALVDLPPVAALAREALAARGLAAIEVHDGADDAQLPRGADAITLVRVLHDRGDGDAARLLGKVADALPAGGTIVVAEPMTRRGRDLQRAYFAAYFAAMGSGRLRSHREIARLLRASGFRVDRRPADPAPTLALCTARKL